jgi:hypothetical protein
LIVDDGITELGADIREIRNRALGVIRRRLLGFPFGLTALSARHL